MRVTLWTMSSSGALTDRVARSSSTRCRIGVTRESISTMRWTASDSTLATSVKLGPAGRHDGHRAGGRRRLYGATTEMRKEISFPSGPVSVAPVVPVARAM